MSAPPSNAEFFKWMTIAILVGNILLWLTAYCVYLAL